MIVHRDLLFMVAENRSFDDELWINDGTKTERFADILPGSDGSSPKFLTEYGGDLFFTANDGAHGLEIWRVAEAPAVPSDTTVSVTMKGRKLKLNARGVGKLQVSCPQSEANGPCAGSLVLRTKGKFRVGKAKKAHRVTLARGKFTVPAGKTGVVRLRVKGSALRLVRQNRSARKTVAIAQVGDRIGNRGTQRKALQLTVAARKGGK
jgi:ELWxxDGT repeat protein